MLTYHCWFEVEENCSRNVFSTACLAKESLKALVVCAGLWWQHTVRLYAMLQAIKLPASIAHLDAALTDVDRKHFALLISINQCILSQIYIFLPLKYHDKPYKSSLPINSCFLISNVCIEIVITHINPKLFNILSCGKM